MHQNCNRRRVAPIHRSQIELLEERRLLAVIFSDDFEGPFPGPWIISSTGPNTSAAWGDNQAKFSSGSKSAFAADNGNDFRTAYDDDLNNAMQLQNVSLAGYSSAALSFNYWLNSEENFDFFRVRVRNQSGGILSTLLSLSGDQSPAGWQVRNLSLNDYVGLTNLIISFEFFSDDIVINPAPSGLWIDDVRLIGGDPTNLPDSVTPGSGQRIWTNPFGDITRNEAIDPASEFDLFAFYPPGSGSYTISTTQALNTQLRIYNSAGQPISPVIDGSFGGETTTQFFTNDWYYIAVAGFTTATGPYTLNIDGRPAFPLLTPSTPAPGYVAMVEGSIAGGDVRYFSLTAPPFTNTLTLTTAPGTAVDTIIELYDAAGNLLQSNNAGGPGAQDLLVYSSITPGQVYYVAITHASRTTIGNFRLEVDFDPNAHSAIRGRAFVDRNSNGTADAGEPGIPGWTLYLDLDEDGQHDPAEPLRITDANGEYVFENLTANSYQVAQLAGSTWLQTSPGQSGSIASFFPESPVPSSGKLQDQFVLDEYKWPQSSPSANVTLTYSYSNLLDGGLAGGLTPAQLRAAIEEALAIWARYAPLTFVEVPDVGGPPGDGFYNTAGAADLRFGYHFIDGVSNILAHAFGPPPPPPANAGKRPGDVHFDSGEIWGLNTFGNVTDIIEVAVHEIGHALGLGHENGVNSIMRAFIGNRYEGLGSAFLFPDDIAGIQAIYGTRLPRPGTWRIDLDQSEIAAEVNFGNFPTIFNGSADDDAFSIQLDPVTPSRVQIFHGAAVYSIEKSRLNGLQFNGLGSDDLLTIDSVNGDPVPSGGINFNGGDGTDTLMLRGAVHSFNYDLADVGVEDLQATFGAAISFAASQHLASFVLADSATATLGAARLRVGSLSLVNNASLDLKNNAVIVGNTGIAEVTNYIKTGSLRSSSNISGRRIGAITNGSAGSPLYSTFAGEASLTGGEVLVLYTLIGDLNLDKSVSISDFIDLASHLNQSGTWREGDLNSDGLITIADFIDLASNFNQSFASATTPPPMPASSIQLASPDPLDSVRKRHVKKQHRHHHRKPPRISPRPHLFRFQI
jgi:hypothetical protein